MAVELMRRPCQWTAEVARDVVPLRALMDRPLESAFVPSYFTDSQRGAFGGFGMDACESNEAYTIHCLLPGIDPGEVHATGATT